MIGARATVIILVQSTLHAITIVLLKTEHVIAVTHILLRVAKLMSIHRVSQETPEQLMIGARATVSILVQSTLHAITIVLIMTEHVTAVVPPLLHLQRHAINMITTLACQNRITLITSGA